MGLDMIRKASRNAALAAAALTASAAAHAAYDVDILPPGSPIAQQIYDLHWAIMWVCVVIFVIVFGAMFYSIFKHRKSVGAKAAHFHENTTVEVIWTVIPFVILIGMAYPATKTVLEMKDTANPDLTIKVTAYQWAWEYDYLQDGVKFNSLLATPRAQIEEWEKKGEAKNPDYLLEVDNPMVVPAGKKVRLLVTSNDVIHGWYVPQLGINQYGIPGFVKDTWFKADKPGTYRGQCSQICGKEHGYMPIVVVAKAPEEYAAWVKEQKAKAPQAAAPAQVAAATTAAAPAEDPNKKWTPDELKALGEKVYAANCVACHQATGKGMPPAFPALDGSKVVTGAKGAQVALVLNGKQGTAMASFARLSDSELAAVITYTRTAWGNKAGEVTPAEIKAARKG
ncbi:MAG: cytochrome c oxidase subunit II [Burkholderiales bacterium]|nr:cytochrome c oxidase subunit II [Burkholderiales bacterium]MCL4690207.1 cytochrome c oxidase subunit II [Burkholderiales bacterium]